MTLKIKMTDQRDPSQPDFPFQNQKSRLVADMRGTSGYIKLGGWTLKYINQECLALILLADL